MTLLPRMSLHVLIASIVTLGAHLRTAMAGPPLICHPIEIQDARSLPLDHKDARGHARYDAGNLTRDTLEILTPDTPVIVRMETLRRAATYASRDAEARSQLLSALAARVLDAESQDKTDALAWFDAGYLAQCYDQLGILPKYAGGKDAGFEWVRKAAQMRDNDAEIYFALSLMTQMARGPDGKWVARPEHRDYLDKAIAGAKQGSLLARNLVAHYGDGKGSLDDLRGKYARRG